MLIVLIVFPENIFQIFLTTDQLTASDSSKQPQDIVYDVIRQPAFGRIEYLSFPNVSIEMFTQLDLLARTVSGRPTTLFFKIVHCRTGKV